MHRNAEDLSKGKDVIVGIMKEFKDVVIKERSVSWNTDLMIKEAVQAGGRGRA